MRDSALPHLSHKNCPKVDESSSYERLQWIFESPCTLQLMHSRMRGVEVESLRLMRAFGF
jgi:hypothetical protein